MGPLSILRMLPLSRLTGKPKVETDYLFLFNLVVEFIGATLVNKIISVPGVQLYCVIQDLHIVVCVHHPKSSLLPPPFISPLPAPTSHAPLSLW